MKTSILTLIAVTAVLSGCTSRDVNQTTSGESADAKNSIASRDSQAAGEHRTTGEPRADSDRNYDSGKGAPALGGHGDRQNASVAAARGSAHSGVTDADHTNALKRSH